MFAQLIYAMVCHSVGFCFFCKHYLCGFIVVRFNKLVVGSGVGLRACIRLKIIGSCRRVLISLFIRV